MADDYGAFWDRWGGTSATATEDPYASFWDERTRRQEEERRRREEERQAQAPLVPPRATAIPQSTLQRPTAPLPTPRPTLRQAPPEEPERSVWDNPAFSFVRAFGEGGAKGITFQSAEPGYVTPEERAVNPNAVAAGEFAGQTLGTVAALTGVGGALGLAGTALMATGIRGLSVAGRLLTGAEAKGAASLLERAGVRVSREGIVFATHSLAQEARRQWKEGEFDWRKLSEAVGTGGVTGVVFGTVGKATEAAPRAAQIAAQTGLGTALPPVEAVLAGRKPSVEESLLGGAVLGALSAAGGTRLKFPGRARVEPEPFRPQQPQPVGVPVAPEVLQPRPVEAPQARVESRAEPPPSRVTPPQEIAPPAPEVVQPRPVEAPPAFKEPRWEQPTERGQAFMDRLGIKLVTRFRKGFIEESLPQSEGRITTADAMYDPLMKIMYVPEGAPLTPHELGHAMALELNLKDVPSSLHKELRQSVRALTTREEMRPKALRYMRKPEERLAEALSHAVRLESWRQVGRQKWPHLLEWADQQYDRLLLRPEPPSQEIAPPAPPTRAARTETRFGEVRYPKAEELLASPGTRFPEETPGPKTVFSNPRAPEERYEATMTLVAPEKIIASHDLELRLRPEYPQTDFQARDLTTQEARQRIQRMRETLDPREVVGDSMTLTHGAPGVVRNKDGTYTAITNQRILAITGATPEGRAKYRQAVAEDMGRRFGREGTPEEVGDRLQVRIVEDVDAPTAIRIAAFSNIPDTAGLNSIEKMLTISRGLNYKPGDLRFRVIGKPVNEETVGEFLTQNQPANAYLRERLGPSRYAEMSRDPKQMAEAVNALFAAELPPDAQRVMQLGEPVIEDLFVRAAPVMIELRQGINAGTVRPEYGIEGPLETAANIFAEFRNMPNLSAKRRIALIVERAGQGITVEGQEALPGANREGVILAAGMLKATEGMKPGAVEGEIQSPARYFFERLLKLRDTAFDPRNDPRQQTIGGIESPRPDAVLAKAFGLTREMEMIRRLPSALAQVRRVEPAQPAVPTPQEVPQAGMEAPGAPAQAPGPARQEIAAPEPPGAVTGPSPFAESVLSKPTTPSGRRQREQLSQRLASGEPEDTVLAALLKRTPERIAQSRQQWELDTARTSPEGQRIGERESRLAEQREVAGEEPPTSAVLGSRPTPPPERPLPTDVPPDPLVYARTTPTSFMPLRMEPPVGERAAALKRVSPTGVNVGSIMERLADIARAAGKDVPIRLGRLVEKGLEEQYAPFPGVERIRTRNDIPSAVHGVAHALEHALYGWTAEGPWRQQSATSAGGGRTAGIGSVEHAELIRLGKAMYPEEQPFGGWAREGFGQFLEMYLTDSPRARTKAPKFIAWFEGTFKQEFKEVAKAIDAAKRDISDLQDAGAAKRMESFIVDPGDWKIKAMQAWKFFRDLPDKAKTDWIDSFHPLDKVTRQADRELGEPIPFEKRPYEVASVYRGTPGNIVENWAFGSGMTNLAGEIVGPPLRDITSLTGTGKAAKIGMTSYMMARRGKALLSDPRGARYPGFSEQDADYIIETLGTTKRERAAQMFYDWNNGVLNYVAQADAGAKAFVDMVRAGDSGDYFRMQAWQEIGGPALRGKGGGSEGAAGGIPLYRLSGSGARKVAPWGSTITQAVRLVNAAHNSRVLTLLSDIVDRVPGLGALIEEVPKTQVKAGTLKNATVISKMWDDLTKWAEENGAELPPREQIENVPGFFNFFVTGKPPANGDILPIRKADGETHWYEVKDAKQWAALTHAEQSRLPLVLEWLAAKPARMLRLGTTGLNPNWGLIWNPTRDAGSFAVLTKAHANPKELVGSYLSSLQDVAVGTWKDMYGTSKERPWLYDYLIRNGLRGAQPLGPDISAVSGAERRLFQGPKEVLLDPRNMVHTLRQVLGAWDLVPRMAEVRLLLKEAGIKEGQPIPEPKSLAAQLAFRRVTGDFPALGLRAQAYNKVTAFFGPSIVGVRTLARRVKDNPSDVVWAGLTYLTAPALLAWWNNKDKLWWNELPAREQMGKIHVEVPGTDEVIGVPLPYEPGLLFGSLPVALFDAWYRNDPQAVKDWWATAWRVAAPPVLPTTVSIAAEQLANREFFFDRPIEPRGEEDLPRKERWGPYTSRAAVEVGRLLNVSPRRFEHVVTALFGGIGYEALRTSGRTGDIEGADAPEREMADVPIVGRLFLRGGTSPARSRSVEKVYEEFEKATKRHGSREQPETPEEAARYEALRDATIAIGGVKAQASALSAVEDRRRMNALAIDIARRALTDMGISRKAIVAPEEKKEAKEERKANQLRGAVTRPIARAELQGDDATPLRNQAQQLGVDISERAVAEEKARIVRERERAAETPEERATRQQQNEAKRVWQEWVELRAAELRPGETQEERDAAIAKLLEPYDGSVYTLQRAAGHKPGNVYQSILSRRKTLGRRALQEEEETVP